MAPTFKVIISNGSFKFHMAPAAAELHKHHVLDGFITAGYPTTRFKRFADFFTSSESHALRRLYDRKENIPEDMIHPLWLPEIMIQAGIRLASRLRRPYLSERTENLAMKVYARAARQWIKTSSAKVYHYRAGYGHDSVDAARDKGMVTLCDHSIAHPNLVQYFIEHQGSYPLAASLATVSEEPLTPAKKYWHDILIDIRKADHILVNSDFVKDTMLFCGFDAAKIHVIYLGVDDQFLQYVTPRSDPSLAIEPPQGPMQFMYAGGLIARKGFPILAEALKRIADQDWRLVIAGGADPKILETQKDFFGDPRVTYLGTLSRKELAQRMSQADVFIFPSLVEGSARVVFEAMAAGCCILATRNSGSILQDGVHGHVIEPGSIDDTEKQIRKALIAPEKVRQMGRANQQLVMTQYRQSHYGQKLLALYPALLAPVDQRT